MWASWWSFCWESNFDEWQSVQKPNLLYRSPSNCYPRVSKGVFALDGYLIGLPHFFPKDKQSKHQNQTQKKMAVFRSNICSRHSSLWFTKERERKISLIPYIKTPATKIPKIGVWNHVFSCSSCVQFYCCLTNEPALDGNFCSYHYQVGIRAIFVRWYVFCSRIS